MRLAVVTPWDAGNADSWSGMIVPMVQHLQRAADIVILPCARESPSIVDRTAAGLLGRVARKPYLTGHAVMTARRHGQALSRRLSEVDCDVVVGITASAPLAYTRTHRPIVQVTDATFRAITDYYPMYSNLPSIVRHQGEAIERRSASRTAGWVVASGWAAESLVQDYGVNSERVSIAPFGPACAVVEPRAGHHNSGLRALVVASNWERKGGPASLAAVEKARAGGTQVRLTVVGKHPPLPSHVTSMGLLPRERMPEVYAQHDVLLELADANAGGVTLTDAAHAGLPVIATSTGGVPDIVRDGVSGYLVPLDADRAGLAARRLSEMTVPSVHTELVRGAQEQARSVLSWDRWTSEVLAACADAAKMGKKS